MRKSKLVLPIISFLLAVVLAVLLMLPVNMYALKQEPGLKFGYFGWWFCACGLGTSCVCVTPEEPVEQRYKQVLLLTGFFKI